MCGIVGTYIFDGEERVSPPLLVEMRDSMAHRGPDGAGIWFDQARRIGFGHRRLSIVDLSAAANQPMESHDGSICITFNGEIYNHVELRRELRSAGHVHWRTDHSDTEVILKAYEEWGLDCLDHLRGMFAFALWDEKRRRLWLVRDRLGIKPLYYSIRSGRISFASEIKALLRDPDQPRRVDEESLWHYLSFLTTPSPRTLFEGIQKLPAGGWLLVEDAGRIQSKRYWDALENAEDLGGQSEASIVERLRHELKDSVRFHSVSDVPVGIFLSGGIDSSANATLFSQVSSEPVRTFTIGYDGEYATYQNELEFARLVAKSIDAEAHERLLDVDDLIRFLPRMVWLQDEPIADPVCVPVHYVSELARQAGVKVCQVGEGSDELFWGYPSWKRALRLERLNRWPTPNLCKRLLLSALRRAGKERSHPYEWLRRGALGQPVFWGGAEGFTDIAKRRLASPRLRKQFKGMTSWESLRPIYDRYLAACPGGQPLAWMTYLDLNFRLPELLLMRVDKMSMGASIETRVPFLDHKLVEFAMGIPEAMKTRHGVLKHILKKAVRGVIPDVVIDRPKQGFGVPIYEWFFGRLGHTVRRELEEFCRQTDYFDPREIAQLFERRQGPKIWYLMNFSLWWKTYIAGSPETVSAPELVSAA